MPEAFFVTDLHGRGKLYNSLFTFLKNDTPDVLLIGGDILPPFSGSTDFINGFLRKNFVILKQYLGGNYPKVFMIMGNDDPRIFESALIDAGRDDLWTYLHNRRSQAAGYFFYGYNYVPPSPYMLKDWERYDVSRYTDIGCISPEEGMRTIPVCEHERKWTTIKEDLDKLTEDEELGNAVFLFHAPPYNSALDLSDLKDVVIDHVPVDPHIGSIAVQRFIEERQPLLTLHGHVHESSRLSRRWMQKTGRSVNINGASEGDELTLVRIDLETPERSELVKL